MRLNSTGKSVKLNSIYGFHSISRTPPTVRETNRPPAASDIGQLWPPGSWLSPYNSAKFLRIRSPSDWLFSGWNWVAKMLSRQIIEQNGPP